MKLHFAKKEDAEDLLEIYKQYIDTTITFEYELPTVKEFEKRIEEYGSMYPYFYCEEDGICVGYVYAHRAQERAAYQWNAELSIYLSKDHCKSGNGFQLYQMMEEILKLQGIKNLYGLVTTPNKASESLHEKAGYRLSGCYHKTGYKAGKWCDVLLFEKQIGIFGDRPEPVVPIHDLPKEEIVKIVEAHGFSAEL